MSDSDDPDSCNSYTQASGNNVLLTSAMIDNAGGLFSGATLHVRAVGGENGEYVSSPTFIQLPDALNRNDLDKPEKMQQVGFVEFKAVNLLDQCRQTKLFFA